MPSRRLLSHAPWRHSVETDLAGKVVVVTGASGGIGGAIAEKFAAEGARLVLHFHQSRLRAQALRRKLAPAEAILIRADLRREPEAQRLFAQALRHFGRVDTLVANAGSWEPRNVPLHKMSLRQWRSTFDSVLMPAFVSLREFFRLVAKQKRGNAILIASTAAVFGEAGHADYAAAKAALAFGLNHTLKNEIARLAPHTAQYCGGRVNCVCPGWTIVPRTAAKLRQRDLIRKVTATMALPQLARPEDIANAVVFLSSDRLARHITGQTLLVAGGMEGRWLWQPNEINAALV